MDVEGRSSATDYVTDGTDFRKREEDISVNNCLKIFVSLVYSGGSIPLASPASLRE